MESLIKTSAIITFVGLLVAQWITSNFIKTELDKILELMSKASNRNKKTSPLPGPLGRFALLGQICAGVVFAKRAVKSGAMTAEELQSLPKRVKRKLKIMFWAYMILFISLVTTASAIKLTGLR